MDSILIVSKVFEVRVHFYNGNGSINTYFDYVSVFFGSSIIEGTPTRYTIGGVATFDDLYIPYGQAIATHTL